MEMEIGMKDDADANDVMMLNRNIGRYTGTLHVQMRRCRVQVRRTSSPL